MSDGRPDLAALERTAREVAREWRLELGPRFELARYSFAAAAGAGAVLKVTPPEDDESDEEAEALELWDGDGAVRLLRHDRGRRALLLERARPGDDLAEMPDDDATAIAVEVGLRLWRPAPKPFRDLSSLPEKDATAAAPALARRLREGGQSPGLSPFRSVHDHVPRWLANAAGHPLAPLARELYDALEKRDDTLVHGDFHHHNILSSARGFLAIDPKPMLGEPAYDVPSFLWNPIPYRMELGLTERRLATFADAGLDGERMRKWTVIRGAYLGADENESAVLRALV